MNFLQVWSKVQKNTDYLACLWLCVSSKSLFEARVEFSLKSGNCLTFGSTFSTMEIGVTSIKSCLLFVTDLDNSVKSGLSGAFSITLHFNVYTQLTVRR